MEENPVSATDNLVKEVSKNVEATPENLSQDVADMNLNEVKQ